jgi:hypothetical protein
MIDTLLAFQTYHPVIVIGCAISKRTLLAIFSRRERFDIRAMPSWVAFTPVNLAEELGWVAYTTEDKLAIWDQAMGFRFPLLIQGENTPSTEQPMRRY